MASRTKAIGKRLDHMERAMRLEERPLVAKDYERQQKADHVYHEVAVKAHHEAAVTKHATELQLKKRMAKILDDYRILRSDMEEKRQEEFTQKRETARIRIEEEKARRIQMYRERKAENEARVAREEKEKAEREAEAARRAEEEERRKVEREAQAAKESAEYEEKMRNLDAIAARQREKEAEIEKRLARSATGSAAPVTPSKYVPSSTGGEKLSWREREALKLAAAESGEAAPSPVAAAPAPATGGYRPPGARTSEVPRRAETPEVPAPVRAPLFGGGGGGWREREAAKKAQQQ